MHESAVGTRKVVIIGAGYTGASIAYALAIRDIAREIALIDIDSEKAIGEARDIRHGFPAMGTTNLYAGDYSDCASCDLIVITAGRNRRVGETRLDMLNDNIKILRNVTASIKRYYTRGVILVISNPVDILTHMVDKWMGLPNGRVFGSGCLLDSSRLICTIADYLGVAQSLVHGYLVGEHGDSQVPIWSRVTVSGIPVKEYCEAKSIPWNADIRKELAAQTADLGGSIIRAKGKTHYGIATCVCLIADAIINMRPIILPVTSAFMGEYGVSDVALSVPSVVGTLGVQQRIEVSWDSDEQKAFVSSYQKIKEMLSSIDEAGMYL